MKYRTFERKNGTVYVCEDAREPLETALEVFSPVDLLFNEMLDKIELLEEQLDFCIDGDYDGFEEAWREYNE